MLLYLRDLIHFPLNLTADRACLVISWLMDNVIHMPSNQCDWPFVSVLFVSCVPRPVMSTMSFTKAMECFLVGLRPVSPMNPGKDTMGRPHFSAPVAECPEAQPALTRGSVCHQSADSLRSPSIYLARDNSLISFR